MDATSRPWSESDAEEEEGLTSVKRKKIDAVIVEGSLDHPIETMGRFGPLVFGIDRGEFGPHPRERQEDALVVNTIVDSFAVVDGMGGYDAGQRAAAVMATELQIGFRRRRPFETIQQLAHRRMQQEGLGENGACYFAFRIKEQRLEGAFAGDVQCAIFNGKGRLRIASMPEGYGSAVENAVQGTRVGITTPFVTDLFHRDRLLLASDGIWANVFSTSDVSALLLNLPTREAFMAVWERVKQRMQQSEGKVDNATMLLYDFIQPGNNLPEMPASVMLRQAQSIDELLLIVDEIGGLPGVTYAELRRVVLGLRDGRVAFEKVNTLPAALGFRELAKRLLLDPRL